MRRSELFVIVAIAVNVVIAVFDIATGRWLWAGVALALVLGMWISAVVVHRHWREIDEMRRQLRGPGLP